MAVDNSNQAEWEMAAGSDTGQVRTRNEDALRIYPTQGIAILSDGMGGHNAGDVASSMAVKVVEETLGALSNDDNGDNARSTIDEQLLAASLKDANAAILNASRTEPKYAGMGATIVAASFQEDRFIAAHLGDSRLYRFSADRLEQLTTDHTLAERYVEEGIISRDQAENWAGRNVLVKGLGIDDNITPDVTQGIVGNDDLYLICSDGLTDAVSKDSIIRLLGQIHDSLQAKVAQLIAAANQNGGPDNISVILARRLQAG